MNTWEDEVAHAAAVRHRGAGSGGRRPDPSGGRLSLGCRTLLRECHDTPGHRPGVFLSPRRTVMPSSAVHLSRRAARTADQPISYFMQQAVENPQLISL